MHILANSFIVLNYSYKFIYWKINNSLHKIMQYQSIITYIFIAIFGMTIVMAQANNERERFAALLQKRKHLNGYWVGKRHASASDENLYNNEDHSLEERASYLVGKRGTYLVGKRASYLVGRKRRDLMATNSLRQ
ncbi:unnamed protein product [Rotaria socialis]